MPAMLTAARDTPEHLPLLVRGLGVRDQAYLRDNPPCNGGHPADGVGRESFALLGAQDEAEVVLPAGRLAQRVSKEYEYMAWQDFTGKAEAISLRPIVTKDCATNAMRRPNNPT